MAINITPITTGSVSAITPFQSAFGVEKPQQDENLFKDMFSEAVMNLEELNEIKGQDGIAVSLGNLDDIAAMQINSQKAEVALQLLVQMRNKVVESYQEIMRINI